MANYNVFPQLPSLEIDPENVSASFSKWYKKYELAAVVSSVMLYTR